MLLGHEGGCGVMRDIVGILGVLWVCEGCCGGLRYVILV